MAGLVKPALAGNEMTSYVINSYDAYTGCKAEYLFDGIEVKNSWSANAFYWYNEASHIDVTLNQDCNLWTFGCDSSLSKNKFTFIKRYVDGTWVNVTSEFTQEASVLNDWVKAVSGLTAGRYRFEASNVRVDSEWYFETLASPFLLKADNQFFSIKQEFYDKAERVYNPLPSADFAQGFQLEELFDKIHTGGEEVNTVHPPMTSNTTPTPYVVTASSEYNSTYRAWKAFDNSASMNDSWIVGNGLKTGWIQIDLSAPTKINKFSITADLNQSHAVASPKDFTLQGSNDGINFVNIESYENQSDWSIGLTKLYILDSIVEYRYYRLDVSAGAGGSLGITICKLGLYYDPSITEKFKPIDKFNNFQIISKEEATQLDLQSIKSTRELIVANDDIILSIAQNIDFFSLSSQGIVKLVLSIDNGLTWKTWDGENFINIDCYIPQTQYDEMTAQELTKWSHAEDMIYAQGIDPIILNTLDFNTLKADTLRFAYVLSRPGRNFIAETSQLDWQFDATGSMQKLKDSEQTVSVYQGQASIISNVSTDIITVNVV